jgi:hypothetical protein
MFFNGVFQRKQKGKEKRKKIAEINNRQSTRTISLALIESAAYKTHICYMNA